MTTLNLQVNASDGDGDQNNNNGLTGSITRTEVRIGNDGNPKVGGVRFTGVTVAQGTSITSATLTITWAGTYSTSNTIQCTIYGEAADNAAIFTATNNNIKNRTNTTANVASGSLNNVTLDVEKSWTVTTIVQEILNRAGWVSGNALAFLLRDNGSTATEWQDAWSYNGSTTKAAKLEIVYSAGGTVYNESGTSITGAIAAGDYTLAMADSGAGVAGGFASGAHAFAVTESGAGIAGGVASGAHAFAVTESGAGIAGGVASGADIIAAFESGAAIIGAIASGLDAQAQSESGYGLAGAVASGTEQFTGGGGTVYNESGAGVAGAEASGADLMTLLESGYSVAGTIATGADALSLADGGAAVVGGVVAGADVLGLSDGGAGLLGAIASGADWLVMYDSGYGLANAIASGAELTATGGEAAHADYVRERGQMVDADESSARATGATVAQAQYSVRARGSKVQ